MTPQNEPSTGFSTAEERLIEARVDGLVRANTLGTFSDELLADSKTGDERLDREIGARTARRIVDEVRAQLRALSPEDKAAMREMLRTNPPPGLEITEEGS
jgi:hypothetical protein